MIEFAPKLLDPVKRQHACRNREDVIEIDRELEEARSDPRTTRRFVSWIEESLQ